MKTFRPLRNRALYLVFSLIFIPCLSFSQSSTNNCLDFDGYDDYVIMNNPLYGAEDFTIEIWVKNGVNSNSDIFLFIWDSSNGQRFELRIDDHDLNLYQNTTGHFFASYTTPVETYFHVAFVKSNGEITFYVNGVNAGSRSADFDLGPSLRLGRWFSSTVYSFDGCLDDLRMWDVARTPTEINNNMYCEMSGNEANLAGYWDFNQGVAGGDNTGESTLIDRTGQGNDGDIRFFSLNGSSSNWLESNVHDCDQDGIADVEDNCPYAFNPGQTDDDCDGVGNECDAWDGCDDTADSDNDGIPDCIDTDEVPEWQCNTGQDKVLVCHIPEDDPGNAHTLCISINALQSHLAHGDYIGPCNQVSCGEGAQSSTTNQMLDQLLGGDKNSPIEIFPNPVTGSLTVKLDKFKDKTVSITITDRLGRTIMEHPNIQIQNSKITLDTNEFIQANGVYILNIQSANNSDSRLFMVQR